MRLTLGPSCNTVYYLVFAMLLCSLVATCADAQIPADLSAGGGMAAIPTPNTAANLSAGQTTGQGNATGSSASEHSRVQNLRRELGLQSGTTIQSPRPGKRSLATSLYTPAMGVSTARITIGSLNKKSTSSFGLSTASGTPFTPMTHSYGGGLQAGYPGAYKGHGMLGGSSFSSVGKGRSSRMASSGFSSPSGFSPGSSKGASSTYSHSGVGKVKRYGVEPFTPPGAKYSHGDEKNSPYARPRDQQQ